MKITIDSHFHTTLSDCCSDPAMTVENVAKHLASRGFQLIAVTDHIWDNSAITPNNFYKLHPACNILKQAQHIRAGKFPLKVLAGCEADMRAPGEFGITQSLREKLDLVIMASDHFHMHKFVEQPNPVTPENVGRLILKFFRSAATSGLADVLAHPLFPCGFVQLYDRAVATISDDEFLEICGEAAFRGVAMEINSSILRTAVDNHCSPETTERIFTLAKQAGCRFTFGSDAHQMTTFDDIALSEHFADRIGLTEADLFDFSDCQRK